jgi:hypothetical protein
MAYRNSTLKLIAYSFLLVITLTSTIYAFFFLQHKNARTIASNQEMIIKKKKKTIFIGVNGLSRENFDYARTALGYFKMFNEVSSHVAPFPSTSEHSWKILLQSEEELPKLTLKELEESIIENDSNPVVMKHAITNVDSADFLKNLDTFLERINTYYAQNNIQAEIILVSDHGQPSRANPPISVDLRATLARAHLGHDVITHGIASGNYVSLFFKDLNNRKDFIKALKNEKWFEQAIYIEKSKVIIINDRAGEAKLEVHNFPQNPRYRYIPIIGNPLDVPDSALNAEIFDQDAKDATIGTQYPDSFFRLAQMANSKENEMPDLIVTLDDAYKLSYKFDKMTSHGSLSRRSSFGVVATNSTTRTLPKEIRTKDILSYLDLASQKSP